MNHYIEFAGTKSSSIGLILENVDYGDLNARTAFFSVPYRQGAWNASAPDGEIMFDRRTVTYTFVRSAEDTQTLSVLLSVDRAWFRKLVRMQVYDSIQDAFFQDVQLVKFGSPEYLGLAKNKARLSVTVSAQPYMISAIGGEEIL